MSSSTQRRFVVFAVLLALGLLAGWIFRSRTADPAKSPPTTATAPSAPAVPRDATPAVASRAESVLADAGDSRVALEAAGKLRDPRQRALEFGRRLEAWIAQDPEAALVYVRNLAPSAEHTQGLLMVLGALGRTDPDRTLALAAELVSTREQRAIYSSIFAQLAAADPAAAARKLDSVPSGESRNQALRALADGWAATDVAAALAWAQQLGGTDLAPAMEAVLATVAQQDPLRAIDLARHTLSGAAYERTVTAALQTLLRTDPREAGAFVNALAPGAAQTQTALAVARALATQNPAEALAWTKTLPSDQLQALALNNVLDLWTARDPAAAGAYVAQMESGGAQDSAAEYLARLLATANPAHAIAWAQALPGANARDRALVSIASTWAQTEPAAAARWAGTMPASELRTEALHGALSYWLLQDNRGAQEFVFSLTGETQTSAATFVAPRLAQKDPVAAIAWTQTLPQGEAREAALGAAYSRWLSNAPAAARTWLTTANLPPATKAKLMGPPPQ